MDKPETFRKVPVDVPMMRFTGDNAGAISTWTGGRVHPAGPSRLQVETSEGVMTAKVGDWVARDVEGGYYPISASVQAKIYEPVA